MRRMSSRRKSELWTSNNKVLTGGSKKPHSRNPNFETEETKLLIQLWGDPKLQKTLITTHKKHPVIMKLADKMRELGYHRSAEEINTRIKNLKCFYNRIKKDIEMGIIKSTTWKHYQAMDEIISRPIFGNRVQQPHLQHLFKQQSVATVLHGTEEDSNGLRPEDLLAVVDEDDDDDGDGSKDLELDVEEGNDMDFEETSLIPKDEPVDMEDMDARADAEVTDVNDIFPKLHQYLQLASKNSQLSLPIQPSDIKMSPASSPEPIQIPSPPPRPPSTSSTMVTIPATANSTRSNSSNKISLVPANLLMKSATTNVAPITTTILQKATPMKQALPSNQPATINFGGEEYVCANQSVNGTQTMYTSTSNGTGPMKVLLVNNVQKPITQQAAAAVAASAVAPTNCTNVVLSSTNVVLSSTPTYTTVANSIAGTVTPAAGSSTMVVTSNIAQAIQKSHATATVIASIPAPITTTAAPIATPVYTTRSTTANANKGLSVIEAKETAAESEYNSAPSSNSSSNTRSHKNVSAAAAAHKSGTFKYQKGAPGFRSLLQQLVQVQRDTLEVSRQRLQVETKRVALEQSMGARILNILQTMSTKQNNNN